MAQAELPRRSSGGGEFLPFSRSVGSYDSVIIHPNSICRSVFPFGCWPITSSRCRSLRRSILFLSRLSASCRRSYFHFSLSFSQSIEFVEYHFHDNTLLTPEAVCIHFGLPAGKNERTNSKGNINQFMCRR